MLAKKHRLPVQFFLKKTGKIYRGRYFLLKVFDPEQDFSRVGVVVGRKVSKKAAERNKLKRIVFNFFRDNLEKLPKMDYLVILLPGITELKKEEIEKELKHAFTI